MVMPGRLYVPGKIKKGLYCLGISLSLHVLCTACKLFKLIFDQVPVVF